MIRSATVLASATLLFAGAASAGARDDLAAFTRDLKGLQAPFTQQVFDPNGKLKETSSGEVALSAPDGQGAASASAARCWAGTARCG